MYVDVNTVHTTHGRALTFATGIKLAKPDLKVIVVMGDGDATAIGGNHLIHAARRNLDLTAIIVNNLNYGMTGGQYSPTTPLGSKATTAPYGHLEAAFDISALSGDRGGLLCGPLHGLPRDPAGPDALPGPGQHKGFGVVEVLISLPHQLRPPEPAGLADRHAQGLQEAGGAHGALGQDDP